MQITYTGPHADGVVIAATGQHAMPGVPIDVEGELAEQLLEQATWVRAGETASKPKRATRKRTGLTTRTDPAADAAPTALTTGDPDGATATADDGQED